MFAAAVAAGAERLVYASSVAAYGFHAENPSPLTEDIPPRGTDLLYYSAQKAELEGVLTEAVAAATPQAYLFRPCVVAGPDALLLLHNIPYIQLSTACPTPFDARSSFSPCSSPSCPIPGSSFQLVHHDDVAAAFRAAVLGRGTPGVYNLAGSGTLTVSDVADALGWYRVPVPEFALDATAELVAHLPFVPAQAHWIEGIRVPVLMDTTKARRELRWRPRYEAHEILRAMVEAARSERLIH